jgi:ADP-ribosylglycohydrolase
VIPGPLLAGNYPGDRDEGEATRKLRRYLDCGVRHFIDLTEETEPLEPYAPILFQLADELHLKVTHERLPIRDEGVPRNPEQMRRILATIDRRLKSNEVVYVHCWGGRGRTGTVVGCKLVELGWSPADALAEVQRLWSTTARSRHPNRAESPETPGQQDYVRHWPQHRQAAQSRLEDRYRGALLGLAVGDALGTTVEFKAPGTFPPVTDIVGGGPFELRPGEWTDDTSMALCLAESLTERRGFDANDQMMRYVRWWKEGYLSSNGRCFDIGDTVSDALKRYLSTKDPVAGSTHPMSAGNGSLMRLASIPMFFRAEPDLVLQYAAESSHTTHGAAECVDACRYFALILLGALNGASKATLLRPWSQLPALLGIDLEAPLSLSPAIAEVASGSFKRRQPPDIQGTGYVVRSLEAALWAFHTTNNFRDGALAAVNLGHDADTTGAVYGQLAGAYYGASGIPETWLGKLAKRDLIERLVTQLLGAGVLEYWSDGRNAGFSP